MIKFRYYDVEDSDDNDDDVCLLYATVAFLHFILM